MGQGGSKVVQDGFSGRLGEKVKGGKMKGEVR